MSQVKYRTCFEELKNFFSSPFCSFLKEVLILSTGSVVLFQDLQENYVFENRLTRYSMESMRVGWETLITSINKTINELENQVLG